MTHAAEFEFYPSGEGGMWVAEPFGMDGATEGYTVDDACLMAADWLKGELEHMLATGRTLPRATFGHEPEHEGGRVAIVAVDATLPDAKAATYVYDAVLTDDGGGGYEVEFPDLPGCYTCGDDLRDAVSMAADAAKTWVASHLAHGESIPDYEPIAARNGARVISVVFDADSSWIVDGPSDAAAQAMQA